MKCLLIPLLLASQRVFAVPNDNQDNALKPYWDPKPGTTNGGCDNHIQDLKTSWEEACLEARQALNDLNFIQNSHNGGAGPDVNTDRNGADRWTRVYNTYLVLFGRPFNDAGQFQNEHLLRPRAFFEQMVTKCSVRAGPMLQSQTLYCNDDHYQHIKLGSNDPEDDTKKIEETHPQCKAFGGVWYSSELPTGVDKYITDWEPPKKKDEGPLCGSSNDNHIAVTTRWANSVTWCPFGLESSFSSIVAVRNSIKGPKTEKKDAGKKIDKGELTLLYKLGSTGKRGKGDMPSTWVHEMGHLLLSFKDEPAFDKKGNPLFDTGPKFDENDSKWVISKTIIRRTYSWEDCVNLALKDPIKASQSPENLANFATAMFLDQWDWRYGYAQPLILHP